MNRLEGLLRRRTVRSSKVPFSCVWGFGLKHSCVSLMCSALWQRRRSDGRVAVTPEYLGVPLPRPVLVDG